MSRRVKIIVAATVAAVVLVGALAIAVIPRLTHPKMKVTAHFEDTVGLYVGNDVSVLGMAVGKVTGIAAKDSYVQVELEIDPSIDIPADVQAVTLSNSLLTDRHVELTPPYRGGPKLKNGDVLGLGRTRTPVEIDRTLAMIDKLGKALRADDNGQGALGDLVNLGSQITSGNGANIKATLAKLSQALRVGSDKGAHSKKDIQAIVNSISDLAQAAAKNDAAIREFGSNLHQLSSILADESLGSGTTGAKLNEILAEAARLLEGHREELTHTFADLRAITGTIDDNQRELAETLDVAPLTVDNLYNILDPVAGSARVHVLADKLVLNGQFGKELCNLLGLKQLGCATGTLRGLCPSSGVKGFGRRFPRRPASLKEGTHVRVEEDIACA
ncbi:MCE family protein, partial [Mycobacterium kiyosense]|uniref:MCE family protein n=1 Tax=Mycobacterium kiyosense TaxID=2871094 RepID=UPI00222EEEC4